MKTSDFYYDLPEQLIAQTPIEPRDHSRLMLLCKETGEISHKHFYDLADLLTSNDVLVVNRSKVIPARIYCHREGKEQEVIELLLLKKHNLNTYECLARPGKKLKEGTKVIVSNNLVAEVQSITPTGERVMQFTTLDGCVLEAELSKIGEMPLPPYIHEKLKTKSRYNTVYAKEEGSSAAPTAGLHFTSELLEKLKADKIKCGVASSTKTELVNRYLGKAGLDGYFDVIIGGEQVLVSKPEPDIFICACERLNVSPGKALVLEDSENGIRAAKAAGIPVICVPDLKEPSKECQRMVTAIVRR